MVKENLKDKRYSVVKNLIEGGYISEFREIFDTLPKSKLYQDLGMNSERFNKLMFHVEGFVLDDLFTIASLIGITREQILNIVMAQYNKDLKEKGILDKTS